LYIWVSNETSGWDVFFDDFSVQYKQGPVIEENHYYPFGLTMAGISDQAIKTQYAVNKYRFQKQELQNKEFSDGSGLEMYEFKYRMDDPQIGRFWSVDPLASKYEYNSPYAFSEDKVTNSIELEGLESVAINALWEQVKGEFNNAGKKIDNLFSAQSSNDHTTSKSKMAVEGGSVEQAKSVETTNNYSLNFGMGDFMEHLTNTNTTEGGPSLKVEVVQTQEISDKTTTTTKVGGLTAVGVETTSRTDGTTSQSLTISGPAKLGMIPNGEVGIGISTDSKGITTFSFGASGSGTIGNSTYGGGIEASVSGSNSTNSGSSSVSGHVEKTSGNDKNKYSVKIQF